MRNAVAVGLCSLLLLVGCPTASVPNDSDDEASTILAWGYFNSHGLLKRGEGVVSVTRIEMGVYRVIIDVPFTTSGMIVAMGYGCEYGVIDVGVQCEGGAGVNTSFLFYCYFLGTPADSPIDFVLIGNY